MKRKALFIGGSAGSLDVLLKVLPELKANIDFPIIIIVHRKQGMDSLLTNLLGQRTALKVKEADEKEQIKKGVVYICPSDYHLLIERDFTFSLDYSEKINYSRPSIDVSFHSAAEVYQQGLTCLLLSGSNSDGVNGLISAKKFGATTWVQDPQSAQVTYMPEQAIAKADVTAVLSIYEMANQINLIAKK